MKQIFVIGECHIEAALVRHGGFCLLRGTETVPVALEPAGDGSFTLRVGKTARRVFLASQGGETFIHMDGETFAVGWEDPLSRLAHEAAAGHADTAIAPMPGVVISVAVTPGQTVHRGQALMVIESMKLQTTIGAARDGVVQTVHLAVDQAFDRGAALVTLEPQEAE